MKKILLSIFILLPSLVYAQTVAEVSDNVFSQLSGDGGVLQMMEAFAYIMGVLLGVKGALKFKEHNESKGQVKISIPIVLCVASAIFLALPTAINVGYQFLGLNSYTQPNASKDKFYNHSQPYLRY